MRRSILVQYGLITLACAVYAVAFQWCFDANHVSVGGFTGLAQILHVFLPWAPIGTIALILNIPLFILGWQKIGPKLLLASLYATVVSSVFIDLLDTLYTFAPMDPILACLYGGALVGIACGVLMRQSSTTGGTELAARLLKLKLEHVSIGRLCLIIDVLVTVVYALIFRDLTRALYGMVALYISSLLMDRVVYGGNAAKVAYIISDFHESITQKLLELDRGVTLLQGYGAYSGKSKQVILCAFGRSQIIPVKKLVQAVDPHAFIIVCDAHEILGEGFGVYTPGSL